MTILLDSLLQTLNFVQIFRFDRTEDSSPSVPVASMGKNSGKNL